MGSQAGTDEGLRCGVPRSPEWPHVERLHRKRQPACVVCGRTDSVQVHHKFPFHYAVALGRPDLELYDGEDGTGLDGNLVTLCETSAHTKTEDHHLLVGHLKDFKSSNLNVETDVKRWHGWTAAQLQADKDWQVAAQNKLTELDKMTDAEKSVLRAKMDTRFPLKRGA